MVNYDNIQEADRLVKHSIHEPLPMTPIVAQRIHSLPDHQTSSVPFTDYDTALSTPQNTFPPQVYCIRHARIRYTSECGLVKPLTEYYACKASSSCLRGGPVEDVGAILQRDVNSEILCSQHFQIRSARYVRRNTEGTGYQCSFPHYCILKSNEPAKSYDSALSYMASDDTDVPGAKPTDHLCNFFQQQ